MIHSLRRFLTLAAVVALIQGCAPADEAGVSGRGSASASAITTDSLRPPVASGALTSRSASPVIRANNAVTGGGDSIKVALLLPVTGRHADLGKALQDAAALSLFDKYATLSPEAIRTKVELVPYDTGDTPEQARAAAQDAVDDGVVLLIGPVFSDATQVVAPIANAAGLSVISFSNNTTVAQPGVYLFGFSPEQQATRVIEYATTQGRNQLAALVPNSAYGQAVLSVVKRSITKQGGAVVAESLYSPQGVGVESAVDAILPKGKAPAFDSLFLPEAGNALSTLLRTLRHRGVQGASVQLLGTGLWDDPTLVSRVNLDGAWFATSPPQYTYAFETRFAKTYNYTPPRVASLSYDAVALAITIATSGRAFNAATLTSPIGFSGPANGIFRFKKDGTSERGLAVLQVRGGGFEVVAPAPPSFAP